MRWLRLVQLLDSDVISARFDADVIMFAQGAQFGGALTHGAHFLTFIESLSVLAAWRLFQTATLEASPSFSKAAQNRLLVLWGAHRGNADGGPSTTGRALSPYEAATKGFRDVMSRLESPHPSQGVLTGQVTFSDFIPSAVGGMVFLGVKAIAVEAAFKD